MLKVETWPAQCGFEITYCFDRSESSVFISSFHCKDPFQYSIEVKLAFLM
jgi:hypothetical protein